MENKHRKYQTIKLAWEVYGNGDRVIFAFHGFGQNCTVYKNFDKSILKNYRIYSFDLPFHGKSEPQKSDAPITPPALKDFFDKFLESERINRFVIMAYSIGAKIGLNLVKIYPGKIDKVILIAPDGLKINFWYNFSTGNLVSRKIFRWVVYHPTAFFKIADFLSATKIVHTSVTRFAESQMGNLKDRELVYFTWIGFRHLNLDRQELGARINRNKIPVQVFLGERDRIIRPHHIKPLIRYLSGTEIIMLPSGHNTLIESTAKYFRENGGF